MSLREMLWGRTRRWLIPAIGGAIVLAGLVALRMLLGETSWTRLEHAENAIPNSDLLLSLAATLAGYLVLGTYDLLALRYVGARVRPVRTLGAGIIATAVSNTLGFQLFTGSGIRLRFWTSWGLSGASVARGVAFNAVTFWLGALLLGGLALILPPQVPGVPVAVTLVGGTLALAVTAGYLTGSLRRWRSLTIGNWSLPLPPLRLALAQVTASTLDWSLAALALWVMLPVESRPPFPLFVGVFVIAQTVGVVSHIPGGLGLFETTIVLLLKNQVPSAPLVGALLLFRLIYYILPFAAAILSLAAWEMALHARRLAERLKPTTRVLRGLAPPLLAGAAALAGVLLLISGAVPADRHRMHGLRFLIPLPLIEVSHFAGSIAGAALLLLASGLRRRLDAAWWVTMVALVTGIFASLLKGFDWEEAVYLSILVVAFLPARHFFYRRSRLLAAALTPGWLMAVGAILLATAILAEFAYRKTGLADQVWWRFTFAGEAPRSLRALIGATLVLAFASVRRLLTAVPATPDLAPTAEEVHTVDTILQGSSGTHGFLAYTRDKSLLFDAERRGFLMYAVSGRSWVAMGDPIGTAAARRELVWDFRERADRDGAWTVFYQVAAEHLALYIDLGLTLTKIGEEAHIPLTDFSLAGQSRKSLRRTHRAVAEREGCLLRVLRGEEIPPYLDALSRISTAWLAEKKGREKGFSVGRFDPEYLRHQPIAVVFRAGEPIAFANVWEAGDRGELSVDLMRQLPDAPSGVMDFLLVELMLQGQAAGFRLFNLGMAPFAGLPDHLLAPLRSQLGKMVYQHGEPLYAFQGLRRFKEKFDPIWVPRYVAAPGGLAFPRAMADVAALISGRREDG